MKSILILVNKYPNKIEQNVCIFIQQLVWTFADLGYICNVVSPLPVNIGFNFTKIPFKETEITEKGSVVTVYHPRYISFGQSGKCFQKLRVKGTTYLYEKAVLNVMRKLEKKPDVLYSHFLCPAGVVASRIGKRFNIPAFMAHGEALYSGNEKYGNTKLQKELSGLSGVIAVSSQNKEYIVQAGIVPGEIVSVFPNGYREERFFKQNKHEARTKFGWSDSAFIVGMCGSFDERKGILRLQDAVDQIPGVYFACAGKGEQIPTSSKCILAKPVNNKDLSWFYSALDVFVLPTQNEGCCNAIVEAIACGCPIISSNRPFNIDICDNCNSILIDPDNVTEIKNAIKKLKEDENLRNQLSKGSLSKAQTLTLKERAKKIATFMGL